MKEDKAGNTKARRITAKMREEWATELDKNGHLFCPMIGCFKKFVTVANFQTHYKWCTGKKDLQKCPYCDSLIITAQKSVVQHMEAFHPERVDDYKTTYCIADSEVDSSFIANENDTTMHVEEVYDEAIQSSKRRKYSYKENKSSNKVIWKHKMKSINEATMKNIDQFQKCVRFDSIVDKINSVDEVVHTIEEIQKATDIKSTRIKKQKHALPENIIEKELYFEDSEDGYTDQEMLEQDSKMKKTGTKAIFVLDKDCYKRYHENLTMTRDWSTARKTYTRSRNSDSFNDSSSSAQVLSDQSQDAFLINDNLKKYSVTLTQQTNLIAQDTESLNSQTEPDCSINLHDEHQLNESIESKNLFLHLEPQNIDSEIVLKTPVKTLEIDLVIQPHQYCKVNQNLYEENLQENTESNLKEQKNVILYDNKTENKLTRISKKQVQPLLPIITYGTQVSENQYLSSRDPKVDFNNLLTNSDEAEYADGLSANGLQINLLHNTPSPLNILKEKRTIWKRLVQRNSYGKYSKFKSTQNVKNKLNVLTLFANKLTKGKNLKQSTQTLNKLKRMKNASTVVKQKMAERQMARKCQLSSKVKSKNSRRKNQFQSNVMGHKKNHIQTKSKVKSHFLRKGKVTEIAGCKRDASKFKSFSEVSDFLYEQTAASYNKVISNVILDCEASLTDYEIVNAENGDILHNVIISGENEKEKIITCSADETSSDVIIKEPSVVQSMYDKTNVSREIIEEVQLISNSNNSLLVTELSREIDPVHSTLVFKKHPDSENEIYYLNLKSVTAENVYDEYVNNIENEHVNSENLLTSINEVEYKDKTDTLDKNTHLKRKGKEKYTQEIRESQLQDELKSNFSNLTTIISNDIGEQTTIDDLSDPLKCLPEVSAEKTKLLVIKSQMDNDNISQDETECLKTQDDSKQVVAHNSTFEKISCSTDLEISENIINFDNSIPENLICDASKTQTSIESENNLSKSCNKSIDANFTESENDLSTTCEKSIDANFTEFENKIKRSRGRPKKKVRNMLLHSSTTNILPNISDSIESKTFFKNDVEILKENQTINDGISISEKISPSEVQINRNIQESDKLTDILSSDKPSDLSSSKSFSNISIDEPSDISSGKTDISSDKLSNMFSDKPSDISSDKTSDIISSSGPSDIVSSDKPSDIVSSDKPSDIVSSDKPSDIVSSDKPSDIVSSDKPSNIVSSDKPDVSLDMPPEFISSDKPSDIISSDKPPEIISSDKLSDIIISDKTSEIASKSIASNTLINKSEENFINTIEVNISMSEGSEQLEQSVIKNQSVLTMEEEELISKTHNQNDDLGISATKKKRGRPKKQLISKNSPHDNQNNLSHTESVSLIKADFASEQFSSTSTPTRISARIKLKRNSSKYSNSETEHNQNILNICNNSANSISGSVTESSNNNLTFDVSQPSNVENSLNSIVGEKETLIDVKHTVTNSKTNPSNFKKQKGKCRKSCHIFESSNLSQNESNLSTISNSFDESITKQKESDKSPELDPSKDLDKPIKKRGRPKKCFDLSNQSSTTLQDSQKIEQSNNSTTASVDNLKLSVVESTTPQSEIESVKKQGRRGRRPKYMLTDTSVSEQQKSEASKLSKKDLEKTRTTGSLQIAKSFDPNNSTTASVDNLNLSVVASTTPQSEIESGKKQGRRGRRSKNMLTDTSVDEQEKSEASKLSKKDLEKTRTTGSLQIAKSFDPNNSTTASVDNLKLSVVASTTPQSEIESGKKQGRRGRRPKTMLADISVAEQHKNETSKDLSKRELEKSRTTGSLQIAKLFDPNSRKSPRKGQPKKCARYADINSAVENCDQILDSSSNDELEVLANMKKRKRRKQEHIALDNENNIKETHQISDTLNSLTEKSNDNSLSKKALKKQGLRKDKLLKDENSSVEVSCDLLLEPECKDSNDFLILISEYDKLKMKQNFDHFKPMRGQWKILSESEQVQYYPPMIKSLPIKNLSSQTDVELNCFENTSLDSNQRHFALFVGGPIWSTAWCPTPHVKAIQYVAIATSGNLAEYHSYVTNNENKCLVQLWNLGYLEDTSLQQSPSLQICLAFNHGNIFDMVWCPYGCWEDPSDKTAADVIPRLGLLAVASSDSFIRIYSFAHPDITNSNFPLYEASPAAILKPLNSNPGSFTEKSACVTVCWEKSSNCEKIAGGYGNGLICVWLLSTSSSLLTRNGEEVTFIPYLIFNAHGTPVTNLAFSPLSINQWLVSNGFEKEVKFWDLNDTCMPSAIIKDGYASNVDWAAQCSGALINYHETVSFRATQFYRELDLESSTGTSMDDCNSTPRITAYSEVMNALAIVDKTGAITTKFANTIHSIFKSSKTYFPRRKTYAGKLVIPPLKHYEDEVTDPFHDYSASAVNTISWNPNPSSCFWLIAGGHSGIARLSNVNDLKMDNGNS